MSRTRHHGYKAKERNFDEVRNTFGNEPKWWRKHFKHKKRRSELRQCLDAVEKGNDDVLFPLDKKPWIYYW